MISRQQFEQDALVQLGYERYAQARPQLGRAYERMQREQAQRAVANQQMLDAAVEQRFSFGPLRRQLGLGTPDTTGDPWSRYVDSAGRFHLPPGIRRGLQQMGLDTAAISTMEQMAAYKVGSYAEQQATFQQGLGRAQVPTALAGDDTAPDARYAESKRQLFLRVQEALAGAQGDDAKRRILRVAFGGPGGEELLRQFGSQADVEANTGQAQPGLAQQATQAAKTTSSGIGTAFGQLMAGLGAPGSLVRTSLGVLLGSKDAQGRDLTAADIGEAAGNVGRAVPNILTLGAAGALDENLRIDESAPGVADLLGSARVVLPEGTPLATIQQQRRRGSGFGHAAAGVAGFVGDVLTDPLSYVTFGAGGFGSAATRAVGGVTARVAQLIKIGVNADEAARLARLGHAAFEGKWAKLTANLDHDVVKAALQDAKAAQVAAETAHHTLGFKGYKTWLAENLGADAEALFPRAYKLGNRGDLSALAARGGISLRAGSLGGINLTTGSGALRGIKPLTAWWLEPRNAFTRVGSKLLDQVAETFNREVGKAEGVIEGGRAAWHRERGLFNAVMGESHRADAVRSQGRGLRELVTGAEEVVRRAMRNVPDADLKVIDLLEQGDASKYAALDEVTPKVKAALDEIRSAIDTARRLAGDNGIDISTLRDLLDDDSKIARYFPHRIRNDHIVEIRRSRRGPDIVGPARARTIRKGAMLTGPTGATERVETGLFTEIQAISQRLYNEKALVEDPFLAAKAYIASVTQAASVNKLFTSLAERGVIVPSSQELIESLNPTQGLVGPGDPIRSIWAEPGELAGQALGKAREARGVMSDRLAVLWEIRADALETRAQQQEMLAALSERKLEHDNVVAALRLSVKEKGELRKLAEQSYREARKGAKAEFRAERSRTVRAVKAQIADAKAQRAEMRAALGQLKRNYDATISSIDERYANQLNNLELTPEQVRTQLEGEIRNLAAKARTGVEPFIDARNRIQAIRNRIAQLESDELAGVTHDRMIREAFAAVKGRHGAVLVKQRSRAAIETDLNDRIALAQDRLAEARRAGGSVSRVERELEELIVNRQRVLEAAAREGAEVGELAEVLSAAEGAMRLADLREAGNLATEAAATFEIGRGMTTKIALPIARLLGYHAADLAREARHMLAYSPRLRFLERAATDYDRASLGALASAPHPISSTFDSIAARYQSAVANRGDEILDSWVKAVGGADHAYDEAIRENSRQMSALLARESDLQDRLSRLREASPLDEAVAADDLNLFAAELDRDVRQLEAWIDNRSEIRKVMATTALAARAAVKEDEALRKALYTTQRTLDTDIATAGEAAARALSDARIFRLMTPQVEHLGAVVGKVPFINQGYAVPREVLGVLNRLTSQGETAQGELVSVLNLFNSFWKRGILLTPGSVFRRIFGNVYNATVLAGVGRQSFKRAFDAYSFLRGAKRVEAITDATSRRYMELAYEHNLFEGQTTGLAAEERGFRTGLRHPIQTAESYLFAHALRGEDIARLAQFIEGLERGMSPEASRLWTAKYHFFNHELTDRERRLLRPLYPFYAYLRNNTALQFYTLFHNPGKINVYGHLMRDMGDAPEGEQEPNFLVQQGGFPVGFPGREGVQDYLQNTLVDTSPLAALHNLLGFEQAGPGSGIDVRQSDLVSSASPLLGAVNTFLTGVDPLTGRNLDEVSKHNAYQAQGTLFGTPYLIEALKAVGAVNPDGSVSPKFESIVNDLFPILARANRLTSTVAGEGGTPSQQEQGIEYALGVLGGPNFYRNTTRVQNAATRSRIELIEAVLQGDPNRLDSDEVNTRAREARVREQIEALLGR